MVYSHFTQCLRARHYTKQLSHHPWYGLGIIVKGPHHFMVMALGSCVKCPLNTSELTQRTKQVKEKKDKKRFKRKEKKNNACWRPKCNDIVTRDSFSQHGELAAAIAEKPSSLLLGFREPHSTWKTVRVR